MKAPASRLFVAAVIAALAYLAQAPAAHACQGTRRYSTMKGFHAAEAVVEVEVTADGKGQVVDVLAGDPALLGATLPFRGSDCNKPVTAADHEVVAMSAGVLELGAGWAMFTQIELLRDFGRADTVAKRAAVLAAHAVRADLTADSLASIRDVIKSDRKLRAALTPRQARAIRRRRI